MSYFSLPISTTVNKFIPKNAFDEFTNSKQKRKFADVVDKITWLNKLSKETINLSGKEITEIQIIEVKVKEQVYPKDLLDIIDKAIPYQVIFILSHQDFILFSTSKKHNHPVNPDNAVVDWTFASGWLTIGEDKQPLNLKVSLDFVYADFCALLTGYNKEPKEINDIIHYDKTIKDLQKKIIELENAIKSEKQFNKKVEMNLQLIQQQDSLKNFQHNK